eukprot:gene13126-3446_t
MASADAYSVLGLGTSASKEQVKEAFRRLCMEYHPDKCTTHHKHVAEARFKEIKNAYDHILQGQAGYAPPPPGTQPNSQYAKAYYRAHGHGTGPVPCGGPWGGYATELDFYRSMLHRGRNNPFALIMIGLATIPFISAATSVLTGNTGWILKFRREGIHMFGNRYKVNGRDTVQNPFAIKTVTAALQVV